METKLLQLALNNLLDEVEKIKSKVVSLEQELSEFKLQSTHQYLERTPDQDELMDIKEVQTTLGICYNSLNKLVRKGLLKPIRINQRRIRFTRQSVVDFIRSQK